MLLFPRGTLWQSLLWEGWGRFGTREENQHLSKCPVEEFDLFLLPLKFASVPVPLTLVLVAAIHNCCLLFKSGREWVVMRCLRARHRACSSC